MNNYRSCNWPAFNIGDAESTLSDSNALQAIDEKLNIIQVQTAQSDSYNITDGIT